MFLSLQIQQNCCIPWASAGVKSGIWEPYFSLCHVKEEKSLMAPISCYDVFQEEKYTYEDPIPTEWTLSWHHLLVIRAMSENCHL